MEGEESKSKNDSFLNGRYSLLTKLGEGGKGVVYKAHDNSLDRTVAIKMLKSETFNEETYVHFMREAQSSARLTHPNIVSMYDVGNDRTHDRCFLAMEFVNEVAKLVPEFLEKTGSVPSSFPSGYAAVIRPAEQEPVRFFGGLS